MEKHHAVAFACSAAFAFYVFAGLVLYSSATSELRAPSRASLRRSVWWRIVFVAAHAGLLLLAATSVLSSARALLGECPWFFPQLEAFIDGGAGQPAEKVRTSIVDESFSRGNSTLVNEVLHAWETRLVHAKNATDVIMPDGRELHVEDVNGGEGLVWLSWLATFCQKAFSFAGAAPIAYSALRVFVASDCALPSTKHTALAATTVLALLSLVAMPCLGVIYWCRQVGWPRAHGLLTLSYNPSLLSWSYELVKGFNSMRPAGIGLAVASLGVAIGAGCILFTRDATSGARGALPHHIASASAMMAPGTLSRARTRSRQMSSRLDDRASAADQGCDLGAGEPRKHASDAAPTSRAGASSQKASGYESLAPNVWREWRRGGTRGRAKESSLERMEDEAASSSATEPLSPESDEYAASDGIGERLSTPISLHTLLLIFTGLQCLACVSQVMRTLALTPDGRAMSLTASRNDYDSLFAGFAELLTLLSICLMSSRANRGEYGSDARGVGVGGVISHLSPVHYDSGYDGDEDDEDDDEDDDRTVVDTFDYSAHQHVQAHNEASPLLPPVM